MGRKSPAFSFYPDSWIGGTMRMTPTQRAAYIDLLSAQWLEGGFDFATALLVARGVSESDVKTVLAQKFICEKGIYRNERLESERAKQMVKSVSGSKGGRKRVANAKQTIKQTASKPPSKHQAKCQHSDSDSDSDSNTVLDSVSDSDSTPGGEEESAPSAEDVLREWNFQMGQSVVMTHDRENAIEARLIFRDWVDSWWLALAKCKASDFCNGRSSRDGVPWVADFDWFIKPDSVRKLVEGKYDNQKSMAKEVAF